MIELANRPLSFTQMTDFLTCRHRWYLRYVLGIRPKVRSLPMELGDGVHRAIAEFLSGGEAEDGLQAWLADLNRSLPYDDDAANKQIADLYATAQAVTERAMLGLEDLNYWVTNDPQGVAYVERDLMIPLPSWPGGFVVKLDAVLFDPLNELNWICDFKTRNYFTSEDDEWSNLQNALYQAGAMLAGIEPTGTLTFQIKSAAPKQPKRNASGDMSRAAVACDWKTYEAAVIAAGLDPNDYLDMKAKLEDKEFVKVIAVRRSPETLERIWNDIVEPIADQMMQALELFERRRPEAERNVPRYLSPRTCNYCGVRPICHGTLKGHGVATLLQTDFNARPAALARFAD